MIQSDAIVDAEARRCRCAENVTAIGRPFTDRGVARFDGAHFSKVLAKVVNVHLTGQISEASDDNETAVR